MNHALNCSDNRKTQAEDLKRNWWTSSLWRECFVATTQRRSPAGRLRKEPSRSLHLHGCFRKWTVGYLNYPLIMPPHIGTVFAVIQISLIYYNCTVPANIISIKFYETRCGVRSRDPVRLPLNNNWIIIIYFFYLKRTCEIQLILKMCQFKETDLLQTMWTMHWLSQWYPKLVLHIWSCPNLDVSVRRDQKQHSPDSQWFPQLYCVCSLNPPKISEGNNEETSVWV